MEFLINGKKVRYNPYNMKKDILIGEGLEADAYQVGDKVVKFFKRYPGKEILLTKSSIEKMKKINTKRILLPTDALLDKKHNLRGYEMNYIEDLGKDNYFNLNKDRLKEENKLLREDVEILSDNNLLLEDLLPKNTVYNNGLYLIDPGSYQFDSSLDTNQTYGINIEKINEYLIFDVLRNYHLVKHSKFDNYKSYAFSKEINKEYNNSGKKDVIEFLSDIEADNLKDFVERRIKK